MMGSRKRIKITNNGSVAIQPGGVWIPPGESRTFEENQLPAEWRAAGTVVNDIADAKVPALITPGNSAVEVVNNGDGGIALPGPAVRATNVGTRLWPGRMERDFDNTPLYTWEDIITLPVGVKSSAMRLIWANSKNTGGTTASPTMLANVAPVANLTTAAADAAGPNAVSAFVGGSATWPLTAAAAKQRRAYVVSDWIGLGSVDRDDGGANRAFVVRSWVNGGNPLTVMGNLTSTDQFGAWATHPSGRVIKRRRAGGNFASANWDTFSATAVAANESPLVGFQYIADKKIVTVATTADSIGEGRGTYLGEGFIVPAVVELSDDNLVWEWMNLAWSGAGSGVFYTNLADAVAAGLVPQIAAIAAGTPNDVSSTITAAVMRTTRAQLGKMLALAQSSGIIPMIYSWMPTNTASKAYGSSDSLRQAYAAEIEGVSRTGQLVVPTSTAISGVVDGTGQMQMAAGSTSDNIHPNDAGNVPLKVETKKELRRVLIL